MALSAVGLTIVLASVLGVYLGFKLDEWLGTFPLFSALFFLWGLIGGFRKLYTYASSILEKIDKNEGNKK